MNGEECARHAFPKPSWFLWIEQRERKTDGEAKTYSDGQTQSSPGIPSVPDSIDGKRPFHRGKEREAPVDRRSIPPRFPMN